MLVRSATGSIAPAIPERFTLRRVLVAFDKAVAVGQRALLTIAGVVQEPRVWTALGPAPMPFTRESLLRDLEREMEQKLAAARDEVPAMVSVTTRLLHGRPDLTVDLVEG